ncbi:hypothetical protein PanWU01x14_314410 [Parasponia andersonii]|uniref:Uncharacterized protein n=1 Tax=Parasponia andersonii TaxID=3476 RepID=A0A2P5ANL3_PARAD|nr:hypothetical protein PanWU01x14_314410 [Parasponia andersonii]
MSSASDSLLHICLQCSIAKAIWFGSQWNVRTENLSVSNGFESANEAAGQFLRIPVAPTPISDSGGIFPYHDRGVLNSSPNPIRVWVGVAFKAVTTMVALVARDSRNNILFLAAKQDSCNVEVYWVPRRSKGSAHALVSKAFRSGLTGCFSTSEDIDQETSELKTSANTRGRLVATEFLKQFI